MEVYVKVAVISDIHGNMQALNAVLTDIELQKCDKIFCLGDLAMAGPEPVAAIEKIKSLQQDGKLELIQGNTDEMIGNYNKSISDKVKNAFPIMGAALDDDSRLINDELKSFLKALPPTLELMIEGVKVLLVHGSPRRNDENILPDLSTDKVEEILKDTDADLIFCGHTHIPCGYQTSNKQTIVNVGSVGRPFTPDALSCYVIAEFSDNSFSIIHKKLDYDKEKACEFLENRAFFGADKLAQILINPDKRHI